MDSVSKLYGELIPFSDLYDSASFEAKKMIVNQLIRRVDVYRGYQLNITAPFNGRNRLLTDSLVLRFTSIVIFRTAHMMACSVVTGHVTTILCHSSAELLDNDFYSAFSR